MEDAQTVYTPGEAARLLGVTTQTLRRYAQDYGEVFEPVVQQGRQRAFDTPFIARMHQAQAMQQANKAQSIRAALEYVRDGSEGEELAEYLTQNPFEQAVLEQLQALAEMVHQLGVENRTLTERLKQLEAPRENDDAETARLNKYLLGELERRRVEAEAQGQRRSWWQLWGRK